MHIPDILPAPWAIAGYGLTGLTTWVSLRRINRLPDPQAGVPKASLLTAAFFVASWIHVPTPLASVHFVLNGMLGVLLGWFAFPAIVIGLLFQAVMFQHGGLSVLGVNALIMGVPALLAHGLFQLGCPRRPQAPAQGGAPGAVAGLAPMPRWRLGGLGFVAGALGLGLSVLAFFAIMVTVLPAHLDAAMEQRAIALLSLAHLPVIVLEGGFTALLVLFLQRVKPELLPAPPPPRRRPADAVCPGQEPIAEDQQVQPFQQGQP